MPISQTEKTAYQHQYAINQRIYGKLDLMTKAELIRLKIKLGRKYNALFNKAGHLHYHRKAKLERIYETIDKRLTETLKVWR